MQKRRTPGLTRASNPKRIEDTDQRRSLTGKVVEIEELKAAKARSAQGRLDLLFVAQHLKLSRSHQKRPGLIAHVIGLEQIPKISKFLALSTPVYLGISSKLGKTHHWPISWLMTGTGHLATKLR